MYATAKQIAFIDKLLQIHDERGSLTDMLYEINPSMDDEEDFMDWIRRQPVAKVSEIIDILKNGLGWD